MLDSEEIRHYDLECESIGIIEGFLRTKIQGFEMWAFQEIKSFDPHRVDSRVLETDRSRYGLGSSRMSGYSSRSRRKIKSR